MKNAYYTIAKMLLSCSVGTASYLSLRGHATDIAVILMSVFIGVSICVVIDMFTAEDK